MIGDFIKKIIDGIIGVFTDKKDTISCKKVIGVVAWFEVLRNFDYCSHHGLQLPDCTYIIIATASTLIGLNTFKGILSLFSQKGGSVAK